MSRRFHGLQMGNGDRHAIITEHNFYLKQAMQRILGQFTDTGIAVSARAEAETYLQKKSEHFNPDRDDEGCMQDEAFGIELWFAQALQELHNQTRLMVAAGMYHGWEKNVRGWLAREFRNHPNTVNAIWKAQHAELIDLFDALSWKLKGQTYVTQLDELAALTNAYKHGSGRSFDAIKRNYPHFLKTQNLPSQHVFAPLSLLEHSHLTISIIQIEELSTAIIEFWRGMPEAITADANCSLPSFMTKAMSLDQLAL